MEIQDLVGKWVEDKGKQCMVWKCDPSTGRIYVQAPDDFKARWIKAAKYLSS